MYKKSQFNIQIPIINGIIIFNSYSGKIISLEDEDAIKWKMDFEQLSYDDILWLNKNHFLLDADYDEVSELLRESIDSRKKYEKSHFRILTTTHCNAHCPYCYENGFEQQLMSMDTADKVISYISEKSINNKSISITWFGGEPLLNPNIITYIMNGLRSYNSEKKITSSMITNGSLIDTEIINMAKNFWNLKKVQITLDGMEERHNSIKQYNNSKYGFNQTINNIKLMVSNGINVGIRINYDNKSLNDTLKLIDYLYSKFGTSISVYCSLIFSSKNYKTNYDDELITVAESIIYSKLNKYRYLSPQKILRRRKFTCGFATFEDYMAIDPNGCLFKCCEAISYPKISLIGNISDDTINKTLIEKWCDLSLLEKCQHCQYLPLCLGGCKCNYFGIETNTCFRYKNIIPEIIIDEYYKSKQTI